MDAQPSYVQMEKEITQHNAQNRVTRQESQIRQLKNSLEVAKTASPVEEISLEIVSSQKVDR